MPRCSTCRKTFADDRPLGARCPTCRNPFYEPPRFLDSNPGDEDPTCAAHAEALSLGHCQRCGNFMCAVCRTKWRDRWLCPECITRILEAGAAAPEEARTQMLQSVFSAGLGVASWVLVLGFMVLAGLAVASSGGNSINIGLMLLALVVLFASTVPALVGLGLGAAALRTRGNHLLLATAGVVLSGINLGALIGLFTFSIWLNA